MLGDRRVKVGLSDYDRRILEELERGLTNADDAFARKVTDKPKSSTNSPAKIVAGALLGLAGMSLLVFAAITHLALIGAAGFLISLVGVLMASANPINRAKVSSRKAAGGQKGSFFEARWDNRREKP